MDAAPEFHSGAASFALWKSAFDNARSADP